MTTKTTKKQGPAAEPQWVEEWLPLGSIIRDRLFQIRPGGTVPAAVGRYRVQSAAGAVFPLIKVARLPRGVLALVDGWHRMEAGALTVSDDLNERTVLALVAEMDEKQARWEAASANLTHGEPLKPGAKREVFKAFIRAKRHVKPGGKLMSYREMTEAIGTGTPHTTLRNWMLTDFPKLARDMGGSEAGGERGGLQDGPSLAETQRATALGALVSVKASLSALTPEARHEVLTVARKLVKRLEDMPEGEVVAAEF